MTKRWRELELRFAGLKRRERGILIAGGVSLVLLLGWFACLVLQKLHKSLEFFAV